MTADLDRAVRLSDVPDSKRRAQMARVLVAIEELQPITPAEYAAIKAAVEKNKAEAQ